MARILVIDDDHMIRMVLRRMLAQEGHEVIEALDGDEGIKLYRRKRIDLILADIFMPTKSGLEVIQELKQDYPDVKIIAITGFGIRDDIDVGSIAKQYGALRSIEKPFSREGILKAVKELLYQTGPEA